MARDYASAMPGDIDSETGRVIERITGTIDEPVIVLAPCESHERVALNRERTFRNVWECIDCGEDVDVETIVHMTGVRAEVVWHDDRARL